ncbi:Repressor of filamentous growth 1 [Candida viswanathii]|uniref:Repressor of filamentous growth 1 n=1 Tax=Candida viswanathii TaxID=5486 RepID=A0A367Y2P9_9ASCO|nr:Repressor of filamentous growth 1 [Candida viswanathii]
MSTAIYYSTHNMQHTTNTSSNPAASTSASADDSSKPPHNTLPSLAQIIPQNSNSNSTSDMASTTNTTTSTSSPNINLYNNSMFYHNPQQQQLQLQLQLQQDQQLYTSNNTTPTNSTFSNDDQSHNMSSHNQNAANSPTSSTSSAGNNSNNKCICKSKINKIPRPRNAFILFRQKYHQTVLDEGTIIRTNPEVSRELGRRWRNLSPLEKDHWNNLAEEEKKNHAKKYPGYRYTPRRNGKNKNCPVCKDKPSGNSASGSGGASAGGANKNTIKSASFSGASSTTNADLSALHNDQYQQLIQKQQQHQIQAQSIANNNLNQSSNNNTPLNQTYPSGNNFQSYLISPNPYQQQQQQNQSIPQHIQYSSNATSQPNSANSQLHFYDDNKLSPSAQPQPPQQQQQQQGIIHHGSISEQAMIGGPPGAHPIAAHPSAQHQFLFNGNNYSTSLPPQAQAQGHPAGSGEYNIVGGGYDARYVYTNAGGAGGVQPGQPTSGAQHYDGFNGIHQPPQ